MVISFFFITLYTRFFLFPFFSYIMVQSNKGVFSVFKQEVSSNRQAPFYCRWTEEEDKLLFEAVNSHGPHKWSLIARNIPNRTPVQCSTRWLGALKYVFQSYFCCKYIVLTNFYYYQSSCT